MAATAPDRSALARTRTSRRGRAVLVAAVTLVLAGTSLSFLAGSGTSAPVTVLPGAAANGSVASVRPLSDTVTIPKNGASQLFGVKFSRIDVAAAFSTKIRITIAWQNPSEFARKTGTSAWQIRIGLYYPVHTGACLGTAPDLANQAVNVTLTQAESFNNAVSGQVFCAYRDLAALGPGAVTTAGHEDQGTQLVATNYLVASLHPKTSASSTPACTVLGTAVCAPAGLNVNQRTYFVVGSLLNPGGNQPPGQVEQLLGMDLFVRATKAGK